MCKINLIVWSKDRACQLDLLLRSIKELGWQDFFQINVIVKWSNDYYKLAYQKCFHDNKCEERKTIFWDENFYPPVRELTHKLLSKLPHKLACFSTDDMVFYREPPTDLLAVVNDSHFHPACIFSLRLGYNTVVQDCHLGSYQPRLNIHTSKDGVLKWNPQNYVQYTNYGYPLALDLHIGHTAKFRDLCSRFEWKTTNELEGGLQKFRDEITELWSFEQSVALNIPCNNLSGITRATERHGYSTEWLNGEYLTDRRIDLDAICEANIVGCHQEIQLTLKEEFNGIC